MLASRIPLFIILFEQSQELFPTFVEVFPTRSRGEKRALRAAGLIPAVFPVLPPRLPRVTGRVYSFCIQTDRYSPRRTRRILHAQSGHSEGFPPDPPARDFLVPQFARSRLVSDWKKFNTETQRAQRFSGRGFKKLESRHTVGKLSQFFWVVISYFTRESASALITSRPAFCGFHFLSVFFDAICG